MQTLKEFKIILLDNVDKITRDRARHSIRGSVCKEDIAILNVTAPNARATKHVK